LHLSSISRWAYQNKVYYTGTITPTDSFIVLDKYGNTMHAFYPNGLINKQVSYSLAINVITNQIEFCNFFWVSNLHALIRWTPYYTKLINATENNLSIYVDMDTVASNLFDTLYVCNKNYKSDYKLNKSTDFIINFDSLGNWANNEQNEYLLNNHHSKFVTLIKRVKQQNYCYSLYRIYSPTIDTFIIQNKQTIVTNDSLTFVLVKYDSLNQFVWLKPIVKTTFDFGFDFCAVGNNRLALLFQQFNVTKAARWMSNFSAIPPLNMRNIILFDTAINQVIYKNPFFSYGLINNNGLNNDIHVIGVLGFNFNFDGITAPVQTLSYAVIIFDSTLTCKAIQQVIQEPPLINVDLSGRIMWSYLFDDLSNLNRYNDGEFVDNNNRSITTGVFNNKHYIDCGKVLIPPRLFSWNYRNTGAIFIFDQLAQVVDTSVCDGLLSPSGKYFYTTSGIYTDTLKIGTCDSIIKLNVTIKNSFSKYDTIVCYSFTTPSQRYTFYTDTTFTDTLTNLSGCDSLLTFNVKVRSTIDTISVGSCKPFISPSTKYLFAKSGIYLDTLTNVFGCDSVLVINFKKENIIDTITINSCSNSLSPSGKIELKTTGLFYDTLVTANGCDSILVINFKKEDIIDTIIINSCSNSLSPSGKIELKTTGLFYDTLVTANGCDSVLVINYTQSTTSLKINKSNNISCDSPEAKLSIPNHFKQINWEAITIIKNSDQPEVVLKNTQSQMVYVQAKDSIGCLYKDSVWVNVDLADSLTDAYNVVTPNNDGKNDEFVLKLSKYEIIELVFIVFDRWGNKVFETNTPISAWNIKDNNSSGLIDGVYYYVLKAKSSCNTIITRNGTIHVINN